MLTDIMYVYNWMRNAIKLVANDYFATIYNHHKVIQVR